MTTQWEYRIATLHVVAPVEGFTPLATVELDQIGAQGWELVSTHPQADFVIFYFKRPKPE